MAVSFLGRIDEFHSENESIAAYLERVELFFTANEVADGKRVPVFLNRIGGKTNSLLRNLLAPEKPSTKTMAQLSTALRQYFEPKKLVIAERFHFHKRSQAVGETLTEYVAELRRLSTDCEFGAYLNEALRDRFVCGLKSESIQRKLLSESALTFARALEIARGMEAAEKNTQQLKGNEAVLQFVTRTKKEVPECYRCGSRSHLSPDCRYKDATCHTCKKKGHLSKVCHSKSEKKEKEKKYRRTYPGQKPRGQANWVQSAGRDREAVEELPLFLINEQSGHPITVELTVNGWKLRMELDTGAAVSIISEETQRSEFPDATLKTPTIALRTYTGESMTVKGQMEVQVKYGKQTYTLPLTIVAGAGPSLLGRDWLHKVQLDWKSIGLATLDPGQARVQGLMSKYQEVFKGGLGTFKHFTASFNVRPDAKPIFIKPRPVPFALKEALGQELDCLEGEGILEKVGYSDWVAPVVPVPKADGRIRLCGDYKVTVNHSLEVEKYPLPNPNDLFATLSGGKHFTKLDLTHAYQQIKLDESSKACVTINTHQGLYRYTRLPFGIASAPAIFQRTMDTILQGIAHTVCYIDDILVTGVTDEEHLQNLEEVLKRLEHHGVKVNQEKCNFLQESVEYLGHRIDAEGIHTTTKKVEAIDKAPRPRNQQQLRSFLGLLQYYGKFVPNLASLLHPLNVLLQKHCKWTWSAECEDAFLQAKRMLMSNTVLAHYDPKLPLRLAGDASAYGVGAVISHVCPDYHWITKDHFRRATMFLNIRQIESLPITSEHLKPATRRDPVLSRVLRFTKIGWPLTVPDVLKPFHQRQTELSTEDDCLMWGSHVIVPLLLQDKILQEIHQNHFGIARLKAIVQSHVWWPGLDRAVERLVKSCIQCQTVKNRPPVAPLHPWSWPTRPWQRIHIDFAGPMLGCTYLVVVDAHSKWPEVLEMTSTTTAATIRELRKLFAAYGLPEQLVSDNGPQFTAGDFSAFLRGNGVRHIRLTTLPQMELLNAWFRHSSEP